MHIVRSWYSFEHYSLQNVYFFKNSFMHHLLSSCPALNTVLDIYFLGVLTDKQAFCCLTCDWAKGRVLPQKLVRKILLTTCIYANEYEKVGYILCLPRTANSELTCTHVRKPISAQENLGQVSHSGPKWMNITSCWAWRVVCCTILP